MKKIIIIGIFLLCGFMGLNADNVITKSKGKTVINTSTLAAGVKGFGGEVPVLLTIQKGRVESIKLLPNKETSQYAEKVVKAGLLQKWNGKTIEKAEKFDVDAVSGATFTSKAVISNVKIALQYAKKHKVK